MLVHAAGLGNTACNITTYLAKILLQKPVSGLSVSQSVCVNASLSLSVQPSHSKSHTNITNSNHTIYIQIGVNNHFCSIIR